MRRKIIFGVLLLWSITVAAQNDTSRIDLLFSGDIMAHDDQLASAWYPEDSTWNFHIWFSEIEHILKSADLCIGNLEVPLGVKPYKGYPSFGSPAEFAEDLKKSGYDLLFTSNNHASDRREAGVINTNIILDSLGFMHTGTWKSKADRNEKTPLIVEKNGFKFAFLNYTYGTNGSPHPKLISHAIESYIRADINKAKSLNPDKIIVCMHWGTEYKSFPSDAQKALTQKMYSWGADYIIGSHPHVLQPFEWENDGKDRFVAYSLGNFISNMYFKKTDGGALLHLELEKCGDEVKIVEAKYILVYVDKYLDENQHIQYRLLPIHEYLDQEQYFKDDSYQKMLNYKALAEPVMKHNVNVPAWDPEKIKL